VVMHRLEAVDSSLRKKHGERFGWPPFALA
jgi:hypothetical protein